MSLKGMVIRKGEGLGSAGPSTGFSRGMWLQYVAVVVIVEIIRRLSNSSVLLGNGGKRQGRLMMKHVCFPFFIFFLSHPFLGWAEVVV